MRDKVLDLIGPTCILDSSGHFVDWNPSFEELIAKPLRLVRGQPADTFVTPLMNANAVEERSRTKFVDQDAHQVDIEPFLLELPGLGKTRFRKIAAQIPGDDGDILGWSVHLVLLNGDHVEQAWSAVAQRLEHEVTWSRYAVVYDQLLLHFTDYRELLNEVAREVDGAVRCIDLGAGTGNSALALLERDPQRTVWAIDSNEIMLRQLRRKAEPDYVGRLIVVKGDVHSLPAFENDSVDAVTLVNTLWALDEPARCLQEAQRILKTGGIMALSTPHASTDVDRLFARMREVLTAQGLFSSLEEAFHAARDRHHAINAQIHRFSIDQVQAMVRSCGFQIESVRSAYVDAVIVLRARKS
jgi:ubiquinone/menaquinone biosynthesis C-methylase UbiE